MLLATYKRDLNCLDDIRIYNKFSKNMLLLFNSKPVTNYHSYVSNKFLVKGNLVMMPLIQKKDMKK